MKSPAPKRGKSCFLTAAAILLALVAPGILLSCFAETKDSPAASDQPADPIRVGTELVHRGPIEEHLLLSGEILATDRVRISPDVSGILTELLVEPGDRVAIDQIIAMVDPSRPGMSYVESPVRTKTSGTVIRISGITGNAVSPQSVIAETGNLKRLEVECNVPERYLSHLVPGLPGRITSRAYPDTEIEGKITQISPVVDPLSRTVKVKLKPGTNEHLRPGQSAAVDLILTVHQDAVLIPEESLSERSGETGVFVIVEGRAHWRAVVSGILQSGIREVIEGLEPGEQIVLAGLDRLTDGIAVQVMD